MVEKFATLVASGEGKVVEKMSRFLSFAHSVSSVDEAKEVVADYANRYHDARHVCWAYMIGPERAVYQSNDNGEPSGTAGKPILGQIISFGITDVVIVVVRYFGGIKLGTSGLITAYREAARRAIEGAVIVEREVMEDVSIIFGYMEMNTVMTLVKSIPNLTVTEQQFDNTCRMVLRVPRSAVPMFSRWQA